MKYILKNIISDPVLFVLFSYKFRISHFLICIVLSLSILNIIQYYKYFNPGYNNEFDLVKKAQKHKDLIIEKTNKILKNKEKWIEFNRINSIIHFILLILALLFNKSSIVSNFINYIFVILLIQQ
tara:strand:+ start:455 stop:829 length:375 start_codon:yes stop_codon:yes gene_type:complete